MTPTLSKAAVNYRPVSVVNPGERCGSCSMYRAGGSCTLVKGYILPVMVCDRWAKGPHNG